MEPKEGEGAPAPAAEKKTAKASKTEAAAPAEAATKFVRLRPTDKSSGRKLKTYHARGFDFVAGGAWVEVPADLADYLDTVCNERPKGAEKGAKAFEVAARRPK